MNQKPIFNLEDTDLGMLCIVAVVLMFLVAIVAGANRIPDWASLLTFGATAVGLIATISMAKLKANQTKPQAPEAPEVIAPRKPAARKRPMPTPKGSGVGTP